MYDKKENIMETMYVVMYKGVFSDEHEVVGVFSSEELANEYIRSKNFASDMYIDEYTLNVGVK